MINQRKGTFFHDLTIFEELAIGSNMLEELQRFMRVNYPPKSGKERVCDPEGHINMIRRTLLTKRFISHEFFSKDVIINLVYFSNVMQTKKRWIIMMKWEN